jgi:hypothetical protein
MKRNNLVLKQLINKKFEIIIKTIKRISQKKRLSLRILKESL